MIFKVLREISCASTGSTLTNEDGSDNLIKMDDDKNKNQNIQINDNGTKEIEDLKAYISSIREKLTDAEEKLEKLTGEPSGPSAAETAQSGNVVEGIFDGENMLGPDGKIYPVPANYASKSKLVEGDRLKLTIAEDGSFIFKQIGPVKRKSIIGTLGFENNAYHVEAEGKIYNILYASVTYYKAKPTDKVTIIVPAEEDSKWAALDNVIHDVPKEAPKADKITI